MRGRADGTGVVGCGRIPRMRVNRLHNTQREDQCHREDAQNSHDGAAVCEGPEHDAVMPDSPRLRCLFGRFYA